MYVITGVTGHTGKVAAETLLARGEKVRVVVRSAQNGEAFRAKGSEVAVADLGDRAALANAFAGAKGAYVLIPPNFAAADVAAWQGEIIASIGAAAATAKLPHLVLLSSIGASKASGTGPIVAVHRAEQAFAEIPGTTATFLRAGWFHENLGGSLATVPQGELHSFYPADFPIPAVATKDIGELAAALLVEGPTQNGAIVELGSPFTFGEAADAIGQVTGKRPNVIVHPNAAQAAVLEGYGVPAQIAALYQEMTDALLSGHVAWEPGRRHVDGKTPVAETIRGLLQL